MVSVNLEDLQETDYEIQNLKVLLFRKRMAILKMKLSVWGRSILGMTCTNKMLVELPAQDMAYTSTGRMNKTALEMKQSNMAQHLKQSNTELQLVLYNDQCFGMWNLTMVFFCLCTHQFPQHVSEQLMFFLLKKLYYKYLPSCLPVKEL